MKLQINLMLFIFLLGAVEIVPLFLGHITGKQYPLASQLQPPIGEGGGAAAGDAEQGSPSGQGDSLEGSTARTSEIERLKEVRRGCSTSKCTTILYFYSLIYLVLFTQQFARAVFPDETPEEMSLPPTSFPEELPGGISGLAWDATPYYVFATLSLAVAAFGNIILVSEIKL